MRLRWMNFVALVAVFAACVPTTDPPDLEGSGPARIQEDVVGRHAREFASELADRDPGSQGEQAASYYILGHLQQAGYVVRLDGVPVGNLVRSTNLMALPPSGGEPEILVAVPYDRGGNLALGVFLELARALHVITPRHEVEFVALGAADAAGEGRGELGARRLISVLLDEELMPSVITIDGVFGARDGDVVIDGDGPTAAAMRQTARRLGLEEPLETGSAANQATVFERAGFEHVRLEGGPLESGGLLLEYLASLDD